MARRPWAFYADTWATPGMRVLFNRIALPLRRENDVRIRERTEAGARVIRLETRPRLVRVRRKKC